MELTFEADGPAARFRARAIGLFRDKAQRAHDLGREMMPGANRDKVLRSVAAFNELARAVEALPLVNPPEEYRESVAEVLGMLAEQGHPSGRVFATLAAEIRALPIEEA